MRCGARLACPAAAGKSGDKVLPSSPLIPYIASVPPTNNKLLEGPILRSLLTLAVPIVLANVLQSAYQIIDAFWVGRLGGAAIAAVSVSFPVMFLMVAVGAGLSIAGSDRKSTRLNSSHMSISYAVFCLKK